MIYHPIILFSLVFFWIWFFFSRLSFISYCLISWKMLLFSQLDSIVSSTNPQQYRPLANSHLSRTREYRKVVDNHMASVHFFLLFIYCERTYLRNLNAWRGFISCRVSKPLYMPLVTHLPTKKKVWVKVLLTICLFIFFTVLFFFFFLSFHTILISQES